MSAMPSPSRPVTNLLRSMAHRGILERALGSGRLPEPDGLDSALCDELWRAGLLRRNGEPGFQISRLGRESLTRSD